MSSRRNSPPMNFRTLAVPDVPRGRSGKHKQIVHRIISDLEQIHDGVALQIEPCAAVTVEHMDQRGIANAEQRLFQRHHVADIVQPGELIGGHRHPELHFDLDGGCSSSRGRSSGRR